jgi:hypothetical protein
MELSMVGAQTSTGVGHPKKLVQRASRGLGKTFFTRKKPVKYAMDGLLASLGPLQKFCGGSVPLCAVPADLAEPLVFSDGHTNAITQGFGSIVCGWIQTESAQLQKVAQIDLP